MILRLYVSVYSNEMNLAVVACGNRMAETLVMIKSAVLFSHKPIHVHIFADKELQKPLPFG